MPATQARTRQLADGSVTREKIAASAAIETSKLADGANFVLRDGTVAFTGSPTVGNFRLRDVGTPNAGSTDAVRMVDLENAISGLASIYKYRSARVAAVGNVNIANPGTSTFDTVTLLNGQRLLLWQQTSQTENGPYIFNGPAAALTRAPEADSWNEFPGMIVTVSEGTAASANGTAEFRCIVDDGGTLGTTPIVFVANVSNGLTNASFVDKEIPSGAINGVNLIYTLANTPVVGSDHVYVNGILMEAGAGNDYTISGNTITMAVALAAGEKIRVSYRR